MSETIIKERPSSIEVNQNAKLQYAFSVKIYFDDETVSPEAVVDKINDTYVKLHKRFK